LSPKIPPKIQKKERGTSTENPEKKRGDPHSGDRVPFPYHLSPKIPPQIQEKEREKFPPKILKKRGVRRREVTKPCRITHL
jgi:hypothetical protein